MARDEGHCIRVRFPSKLQTRSFAGPASMSPWITTRLCARLRNATRYASLPCLPPLAITSTLHATGLLMQPSDNAPSGLLVLSAFVGLPIALWAYKVRSCVQSQLEETRDRQSLGMCAASFPYSA